MRRTSTRPLLKLVALAAIAALAVGCASSNRDGAGKSDKPAGSASSPGSSAGAPSADSSAPAAPAGDGTFIFGAAGAPATLDPLYATDGETFRISRQMFQGLVSFKAGTADVEPQLAESWEKSTDGKTWTFKVRKGVKFHDGTDFDAAAVCFNLDRMYQQTGAGATQAKYWSDTMGGFKDQKDSAGKPVPSLYQSCTADGDNAVIKLASYTSKFPAILGLPSFSMQSPKALEQYKADDVKAVGEGFEFPAYANEHPTGTGPFKFGSYDKANNTVELLRNDAYWGPGASNAKLIFKILKDETVRKQELQAGTIDGFDYPNPADWKALKDAGFQVEVRPAFNLMYLGITQKNNEKLKDLKVRQAIAYAINREQLVQSQLPEGAEVASQWYPKTVEGWSDKVQKYAYDPAKAKALLAEAGASDLQLNFWWPTEVTRPYMPDPKSVFTSFKTDLEAVGIKINEVSKPWNGGYLDGVSAHQADLFLLGWTGDYNTPDNFIGTFFTDVNARFYTVGAPWGKTLSEALTAADGEPDDAKRKAMYEDINVKLMSEYMPGVPISHSPPALVLAKNVSGIVPSPLTDERFDQAVKK